MLSPNFEDIAFSYKLFADWEVEILEPEEFCALMRLVRYAAARQVWTYTPPVEGGSFALDERQFARVCQITVRQWRRIEPRISKFFIADERGWTLNRDWIRISGRAAQQDQRPAIPASLRSAVMQRDNFRCQYCGNSQGPFHCDHVRPVAQGGATELNNLPRRYTLHTWPQGVVNG